MDMTPYSYREHILVLMPSGATLVHADVKGSARPALTSD